MTDIRLPLGNVKFSVRAVILCTRADTLLMNCGHGEHGSGFHFLPGGAVRADEDSAQAAAREWHEETGLTAGELRLVGIVESFFGPPGRREHEIGFYYHLPAPPDLPDGTFTVHDNPDVQCQWVPFDRIEATPVYPLIVRDLLRVPPGEVRHLLNREA